MIVSPQILDQIKECLRDNQIQSPVETRGETHTLTPEPERIDLERFKIISYRSPYPTPLRYEAVWQTLAEKIAPSHVQLHARLHEFQDR